MEAHGSVAKAQDIEFKALEGSLSMMSKGELYFMACARFISADDTLQYSMTCSICQSRHQSFSLR